MYKELARQECNEGKDCSVEMDKIVVNCSTSVGDEWRYNEVQIICI